MRRFARLPHRRFLVLLALIAVVAATAALGFDVGRAPAAQTSSSDYAIFALQEDCDARAGGITWTGSAARVEGRVQSNSGLAISGAMNTITGEVGYVCDVNVRGAGTQIGRGPTKGAALPPPSTFKASDFRCDFTLPDGDLETNGAWWEGGRITSRRLKDGVYCAEGRIRLRGAAVSGKVTFVATGADGRVEISGARFDLQPFARDVLAYAEGTGTDAITLTGAAGRWEGVLYAPRGEVNLNGARIVSPRGLILANTVKLIGSAWSISALTLAQPTPQPTSTSTSTPRPTRTASATSRPTGTPKPSPTATTRPTGTPLPTLTPTPVNEVSDSRGAIRVRVFVCNASSYPADFDWDGRCLAPVVGAAIELSVRTGTSLVFQAKGTTDAAGALSFPLLSPGSYQVKQTNTTWCRAESDSLGDNGDIVVQAGQRSRVYIYNCPSK